MARKLLAIAAILAALAPRPPLIVVMFGLGVIVFLRALPAELFVYRHCPDVPPSAGADRARRSARHRGSAT